MRIRKLTEYGQTEFTSYISRLRDGGVEEIPLWLLEHSDTSVEIEEAIDVEDINFSSRYEMGEYLCKKLKDTKIQKYIGDQGFWSWLALFWFSQLCPENKDKSRNPSMYYNYVLSKDYKHRPRQAVYMSWQLVHMYGEDARFLLCKEMSVRGELIEQLMARQDILSMRGVMTLASSLYTDKSNGQFKRGAAARDSAGCVSRFVSFLQQLELTYDLYMLKKNELEDLLPGEFAKFMK